MRNLFDPRGWLGRLFLFALVLGLSLAFPGLASAAGPCRGQGHGGPVRNAAAFVNQHRPHLFGHGVIFGRKAQPQPCQQAPAAAPAVIPVPMPARPAQRTSGVVPGPTLPPEGWANYYQLPAAGCPSGNCKLRPPNR